MELRYAFLLLIRRDRYIIDVDSKKKFHGGFDYSVPIDCNWSFRQFGEVLCSTYPWGLHDEVEFKYYDGGTNWVKVSNDAELATMFATHKETDKFRVRLQVNVVVPEVRPRETGSSSRTETSRRKATSSQNSSVHPNGRGGSTSVGRRDPDEVEADAGISWDDEERLYGDVVQNLRRAYVGAAAEITDEADNEQEDDEEEDLPAVEWDPENPHMAVGSVFASMSECRNAFVTYCIKAERAFIVDKSDRNRYTVHCVTEGCPWRMHASKMRRSKNIQVKVNPFSHTCEESTLRKETVSKAKSKWVAEAVKKWVTENHQVGTKELMKNIKDKFKIDLPYMRVFNGKEKAMESIYGKWHESFELLYSFKAEVGRTSPGSIVEIDHHSVEYTLKGVTRTKECFRRVFVCFEACRRGFLAGCRPYLAIDATFLTGRFKGQLVAACAVDAHNFVFPVAYGVLETESEESWTWFLQQLRRAIAHPEGLVIHTDACKGLEVAVDNVFPGVEHRECMRHLAANFMKKFKGKIYSDNLWPASLTCSVRKHNYHMRQLYTNPKVKEYLETHHSKLWARSQFSELSKVDYVHNNLAESFNSTIRKLKDLYLVDLLDKIRIEYAQKFHYRDGIAEAKFMGHIIIPSVMNELKQKTVGLVMNMILLSDTTAEVTIFDKNDKPWRYPVDLEARTCSCRKWQITGLPCIHALFFITSLSGPAGNIQQYVHEYYSVARFKTTYAHTLPALEGKQQWDRVDPGFKLCAPVLKRAAGRPRKSRFRRRSEGAGVGARMRKCKRCGGSGHFGNKCDNAVDPAFGEFSDENLGSDAAADAAAPRDDAPNDDDASDDDAPHDDAPNDAEPESVGEVEPEDDADAEPEDAAVADNDDNDGDQPSARYVNVVHLSLYVLLQFVLKIYHSLFVQITRKES